MSTKPPPPATVAQVRLPPDLTEALAQRAARDGTGTSDVIRETLRAYLSKSPLAKEPSP